MVNIDQLRKLAEAASPGKWFWNSYSMLEEINRLRAINAELIECVIGFTGLADMTTGEYMTRFGISDGQMSFSNAWDKAMDRARVFLDAEETP